MTAKPYKSPWGTSEERAAISARHSKATPRWGTPDGIVARARTLLGPIDLDPFSEATFNEVVKASRYFTEADNGLVQPWDSDALFINPPGGLVVEAWRKLQDEIRAGRARSGVWVGFSVEQLGLLAPDGRYVDGLHPVDFSCVLTRKRIGFTRHDGFRGAPSHGNYIMAFGVPHVAFVGTFGDLGKVIAGPYADMEQTP